MHFTFKFQFILTIYEQCIELWDFWIHQFLQLLFHKFFNFQFKKLNIFSSVIWFNNFKNQFTLYLFTDTFTLLFHYFPFFSLITSSKAVVQIKWKFYTWRKFLTISTIFEFFWWNNISKYTIIVIKFNFKWY